MSRVSELREEMNAIVKSYLPKYKERLLYWIDNIGIGKYGDKGRHGNYRTQFDGDLDSFTLIWEVRRLRHDPLFPDYDSNCLVPFDYMEVEDWKAHVDDIVINSRLRDKEQEIENIRKEIREQEGKEAYHRTKVKSLRERLKGLVV